MQAQRSEARDGKDGLWGSEDTQGGRRRTRELKDEPQGRERRASDSALETPTLTEQTQLQEPSQGSGRNHRTQACGDQGSPPEPAAALGEGSNHVDRGGRVHIKWALNSIVGKAGLRLETSAQRSEGRGGGEN